MRAPIHSVKHIVQFPISQITTGALESITLISAVESTTANLSREVAEGSIVKSVFVELWIQNEGTLGESIVTISKGVAGDTGPTFAEQAALFTYNNKKNILFTHQGLTPNDGVSGPIPIIRSWLKIPKGKQRFGLGDRLDLNISNVSSNDLVRCGMAIYKEYS